MRRIRILAAVVLVLGGVGGGLFTGRASAGDAPPSARPAPPAPDPKADLARQTVDLGKGIAFEMVLIPAGEFDMGSPETERARNANESAHRVRIREPYWMATTETTQQAWEAVMGSNPSRAKGPTRPVSDVSWHDCQAFLKRLNEKVGGGGFRLPTEAEWERACRAGSATRFCFGDDERRLAEYGWCVSNSGGAVHPVGELKPNAWGLRDMHGNVWEWCSDSYARYEFEPGVAVVDPSGPAGGRYRVMRGGSAYLPEGSARSAARVGSDAGVASLSTGLRLARSTAAGGTDPGLGDRGGAPLPPAVPGDAPRAPPPAPTPGEPAPPVAPPAKEG